MELMFYETQPIRRAALLRGYLLLEISLAGAATVGGWANLNLSLISFIYVLKRSNKLVNITFFILA